ncbi:MAG TPA: hypothetical protein VF788_10305 [Pseudonocardiaceae bacterium]
MGDVAGQARHRGITVRGIEQAQLNDQDRRRLIQRALREAHRWPDQAGHRADILSGEGRRGPRRHRGRTVVGKALLVV